MKITIKIILISLLLNSCVTQNCKNFLRKDNFTKLDSVIVKNSGKRLYNYDICGNNIQVVEQKWENNKWVNITKYENIFNKKGELITEIKSNYDMSWIYASKTIHVYDSGGDKIETVLYLWRNNKWVESLKFEFKRNSKSQIEYDLTYRWHDNSWDFDKKRTYVYESDGEVKNSTLFMWNNSLWKAIDRTDYKYDDRGLKTLLTNYNWNDSVWCFDWKGETFYNEKNKKEQEIGYAWKRSEWVKTGKDLYKYDNVSFEHIHYILKDTAWLYHSKELATNDERGNIINNKTLFWDDELLKWKIKYEERISVDTSVFTSNVVFPINDGIYGFKNQLPKNIPSLIEILDWDDIENKLKISKEITFYYSDK